MPGNTPASAIAAPAVAGLWPAHRLSPCRRSGLCGLHRQSACGLQRAVAGGRPAVCGPGGGCFTIPPVIKSLQAGCGPVVAGMPACQTCRPTVWNGTSGFVVRPVMPGVFRRLATCCARGVSVAWLVRKKYYTDGLRAVAVACVLLPDSCAPVYAVGHLFFTFTITIGCSSTSSSGAVWYFTLPKSMALRSMQRMALLRMVR